MLCCFFFNQDHLVEYPILHQEISTYQDNEHDQKTNLVLLENAMKHTTKAKWKKLKLHDKATFHKDVLVFDMGLLEELDHKLDDNQNNLVVLKKKEIRIFCFRLRFTESVSFKNIIEAVRFFCMVFHNIINI